MFLAGVSALHPAMPDHGARDRLNWPDSNNPFPVAAKSRLPFAMNGTARGGIEGAALRLSPRKKLPSGLRPD